MKYKVYFEYQDGTRDDIIISGDTIEELRETAQAELERRNALGVFSEKIED